MRVLILTGPAMGDRSMGSSTVVLGLGGKLSSVLVPKTPYFAHVS